jgi:hypothetical protein
LGLKVVEEDAVFVAHGPGRNWCVAEPGRKDEDIKILVPIHRLGKNAPACDTGNWVVYDGCVVGLKCPKIVVSGRQAATPRLVGWYELRHHIRVIVQPLAHQLLYVGSEGRLHVLVGLAED